MKKPVILLWFAAVFLTVFSSKLWLIDLFGSPLPWWDQWEAEGWLLYVPFLEKTLALKDMFAAHCEHRIFANRALSLLTLAANGQWDARVGMVINALVTAGTGTALSAMGWRLLGRRNIAMVCLFNTAVFSLPFSWECSLLGFVGNYLLIAFALLAVWLLLKDPFRPAWWAGLFFAILSLVTMGSGFFAALAVAGILILRIASRSPGIWLNLCALAAMLAVVTAGLLLRVQFPGHEAFMPRTFADLLAAFAGNMAWPHTGYAWAAVVTWLPSLLAFIRYAFNRDQDRRSYEFVLAFGLWIALQAAALALARCGILASRHTVFLSLALPLNFLALLMLLHDRLLPRAFRNFMLLIVIIWAGFAGRGLLKISDRAGLAAAEKTKQHFVQSEMNVRNFIETGDEAALQGKAPYDIPYPDPHALALVLRNPHIRAIMPAAVSGTGREGPLSLLAAWMIPKGDKAVFIGIALLLSLGAVRFYQSLGALEKRLATFRRKDIRALLVQAGMVLACAALLYLLHLLYAILSPGGITATYFKGRNFEEKICSRTEKAICRDYGVRSPAWHVPRHNFSAIWEGYLMVPETGDYLFHCQSDDGLRLIIDGEKLVDNWQDQSWMAGATGCRKRLEAGARKIAVEYYNGEGEAALRVRWCGGPVPPNTVLAVPYLRKRK